MWAITAVCAGLILQSQQCASAHRHLTWAQTGPTHNQPLRGGSTASVNNSSEQPSILLLYRLAGEHFHVISLERVASPGSQTRFFWCLNTESHYYGRTYSTYTDKAK